MIAPPRSDHVVVAPMASDLIARARSLHAADEPTVVIVDAAAPWAVRVVPGRRPCLRCAALRFDARGAQTASPPGDRGAAIEALLRSLAAGPPRLACWTAGATAGAPVAHPVMPHPRCEVCREAPQVSPPDAAGAAAETARFVQALGDDFARPDLPAHAVATLLDPVCGPVVLAEDPRFVDERLDGAPIITGGYAYNDRERPLGTGAFGAVGTGSSDRQRRLVCISECLERYALVTAQPDFEAMPASRVAELSIADQLTAFSEARLADPSLGYPRLSSALPLAWSWVTALDGSTSRLVPHEWIGNRLDPARFPVRLFDQSGSTGAASHASLRMALWSALREIVERDAWTASWLFEEPGTPLDLDLLARVPEVSNLLGHLMRRGIRVRLFDIRLDHALPVVVALGTAQATSGAWRAGVTVPAVSGGATVVEAAAHALDELRLDADTFGLDADAAPDASTYDPADPHAGRTDWRPLFSWFLAPEQASRFAFFDAVTAAPRAPDREPTASPFVRDRLAALVTDLSARGHLPYARIVTPAEARGAGLTVVRVVVPGLLEPSAGAQTLRLGTRRLEHLATRLGRKVPSERPVPVV